MIKKTIFLFVAVASAMYLYAQDNQHNNADLPKKDSLVYINTGFGKISEQNVTGSISQINFTDFNSSICKNSTLQLVQNKLTGLMMSLANSSDPTNRDMEFAFRGISSIYFNTTVTYIIDGVPGDINSIAPDNIKTITLLRDVSSVNRFGSFANGPLVLIETKSAGSNKLNVNYSTCFSTELFAKYPNVYSADKIKNTNMSDLGHSTNWFDELLQNNMSQQHHLSIASGFDHLKIYGSFNYSNFEGVVKKSDSKHLNGLLKLDFNAFNNCLNINVTGNINQINEHPTNYEIFEQAIKQNPTQPVYDENGEYSNYLYRYKYYNPVNFLNESDFKNKINANYLKGSVDFKILEGWNLHADIFTAHTSANNTEAFSANYQTKVWLLGDGTIYSRNDTTNYTTTKNITDNSYFDLYTNYSKSFGKHNVGISAGLQFGKNEKEVDYYIYYGVIYDENGNNKYDPDHRSSQTNSTMHQSNYWGNINYNFNHRYIFDFSVTHFLHPYSFNNSVTNPAATLAWIISNEGFLKDNSFISLLKLKTGYGVKTLVPSYWSDENFSEGVTNEEISEYTIGLEWAILNYRISGSIDFYSRTTDNVIMKYGLPSPPYFYDYIYTNLAKIKNQGFEIGLQATPIIAKNFAWKVFINYSTNKNKFNFVNNPPYYQSRYETYGSIDDPISMPVYQLADGEPIGNFFGLKTVDVDKNGYLIVETADGERSPFNTDLSMDVNKQVIGNGIPKHFLSIANTFTYKYFDLAFNLHGAFGFHVLNSQRMFYENRSINYNQLTSSSNLVYGKAILSKYEQQGYLSYYVEDGDYLKIDNITLGYTTLVNKVISSLRVYLSAQNLHTFTKYKGIDPELSIGFNNPGYEKVGVYPLTTIFALGVNITL